MKNLSREKALATFEEEMRAKAEAQGLDSQNLVPIVFQNLMIIEGGESPLDQEEKNLLVIEERNLHLGKETKAPVKEDSEKKERVLATEERNRHIEKGTKALVSGVLEKEEKLLATEGKSHHLGKEKEARLRVDSKERGRGKRDSPKEMKALARESFRAQM